MEQASHNTASNSEDLSPLMQGAEIGRGTAVVLAFVFLLLLTLPASLQLVGPHNTEELLLATERYDKSDPVNLGSSSEISIRALVEMITRLTGFEGDVGWDASKPDGQPRRKLDVERARKEFGFASAVGFEEGLRKTIDWYERNRSPAGRPAATARN